MTPDDIQGSDLLAFHMIPVPQLKGKRELLD
jgi:hypothetical protein